MLLDTITSNKNRAKICYVSTPCIHADTSSEATVAHYKKLAIEYHSRFEHLND